MLMERELNKGGKTDEKFKVLTGMLLAAIIASFSLWVGTLPAFVPLL